MDMTIKRYVLGYCLTRHGVLLIQKTRPPKWNGIANAIGGSIEPPESPDYAMVREFAEETGRETTTGQWQLLTKVWGKPIKLSGQCPWEMYVFWTADAVLHQEFFYSTREGEVSVYKDLPSNIDRTAQWLYYLLLDHIEKGLLWTGPYKDLFARVGVV